MTFYLSLRQFLILSYSLHSPAERYSSEWYCIWNCLGCTSTTQFSSYRNLDSCLHCFFVFFFTFFILCYLPSGCPLARLSLLLPLLGSYMYIKEEIISSIIFMHLLCHSRRKTINTLETCGSYIFYFVEDCSVLVSTGSQSFLNVACLRENLIAGCGVKQAMNFKF